MVVGEHYICMPPYLQLAMAAKAFEPKKLHVVRGAGHFEVHYGEHFEENIKGPIGVPQRGHPVFGARYLILLSWNWSEGHVLTIELSS